jgi:hypothetical protein
MSRHLILPLILLGISILVFALSYRRYQLRMETVKEENLVVVTIKDVNCYGPNSYSSLIFKYNGAVQRVNMTRNRCGLYKKGEQIKVYYNRQSDWWVLPDDGREEEEIMTLYGTTGIRSVIQFVSNSITLFCQPILLSSITSFPNIVA